jgi:transcription elongation factor B subunit 1
VVLGDMSAAVLERVVQYLHYKLKWSVARTPPPEFEIPPEQALELLVAANYLEC